MEIFPEADKSCKDSARMYYGGKNLVLFNDYEIAQRFNLHDLVMNLCRFYKDRYGFNHYGRYITKFCSLARLKMNDKKMPMIFLIQDENDQLKYINGNLDGSAIILLYITKTSELPNSPYCIVFESNNVIDREIKKSKSMNNSKYERRGLISKFDFNMLGAKCKLFNEFTKGSRWLWNNELVGILSNLMMISGGAKLFVYSNIKFPVFAKFLPAT